MQIPLLQKIWNESLEHADCWNGHFCKFVYNKVEIRIAGAVKCLGAKYLLPLTL